MRYFLWSLPHFRQNHCVTCIATSVCIIPHAFLHFTAGMWHIFVQYCAALFSVIHIYKPVSSGCVQHPVITEFLLQYVLKSCLEKGFSTQSNMTWYTNILHLSGWGVSSPEGIHMYDTVWGLTVHNQCYTNNQLPCCPTQKGSWPVLPLPLFTTTQPEIAVVWNTLLLKDVKGRQINEDVRNSQK